jgi:hypothetical protein
MKQPVTTAGEHITNPAPDYEKAELDLLRQALKRTHTERFLMMTRLMKIGIMLNRATIIRKPYNLDK